MTILTFTNSADGPIEVHWIDGNGNHVYYDTLDPGETASYATHVDHNWALKDEDGIVVKIIEGGNQTVDFGADGLNDTIYGGAGDDSIYGQFGDDTIHGNDGDDKIHGGTGDDTIEGDADDDSLYGGAGDDALHGGTGDDALYGGDGADTLRGGVGDNTLDGGSGSDTLHTAEDHGNETIIGGEGGDDNDTLWFSNYSTSDGATITFNASEAGSGTLGTTQVSFSEIETIIGTEYDDVIDASGSSENQTLQGQGGDDTIIGGDGDDIIEGGSGDDLVDVSDGSDTINLGGGTDHVQIVDNDGHDSLDGGDGFDRLDFDGTDSWNVTITEAGTGSYSNSTGTSGDFTNFERISGGSGDDIYDASSATQSVQIDSSGGDDTVYGGSGADTLEGEKGDDTIHGGAGDDHIDGGSGDDTLTGGAGDDTFVWNVGDGHDTIIDFNAGNTGTLNDGDSTNNDFVDLSGHYDHISELYADQADDGVLNQSNSTDNGGTVDYSDNTEFGSGSLTFQGASAGNSSFTQDTGVVCFTSGTQILTPRGEVPIDLLRPGDLVCTQDNGPQPVLWIASRTLGRAALQAAPHLAPILIGEDVLGGTGALLVSPQHGLLLGSDRLIRAKHLAAHMPGVRVARGKTQVRYVHLLFDRHEIIFAECIPTESFLPVAQTLPEDDAAHAEIVALFP